MTGPLVLYHARCPDGMASAWVVQRLFASANVEAEFVPMDYGSPTPAAVGRPVYLVDYCLPLPAMEALLAESPQVTVVDHHKTAAPVYAALARRPKVTFVFDEGHSGGFLAWRHFFPDEPPPPLVLYTEDRDLWRWQLPFSREISAYLSTLAWGDFLAWDAAANGLQLGQIDPNFWMVQYGKIVLDYQERLIEDHLRTAFETELDGHKVLAVNCSCAPINSELTGRLAAGRAFGLSWFVRADGLAQASLRARGETGIDVTTIAKQYGGGGHAAAAGFQVPPAALPFVIPRAGARPAGGAA